MAALTVFTGGPENVVIPVSEESQVGSARRAAQRMAGEAGMTEPNAGSLSLIVTEAAANIARHGANGSIILADLRTRGRQMIEMIAVDKGPGIDNMARALADGFSTSGTRGQGLGAMKRMAGEFDWWSVPSNGTAVLARVAINKNDLPTGSSVSGVVCTAVSGESVCGDAWLIEDIPGGTLIAVADGLGHGYDAAVAADTALDIVRRRKTASLPAIFEHASSALMPTRGAALQIIRIDARAGSLSSAGVGNISASVSTHLTSKSLPSQPGIVGHQMPRVRELAIPWTRDSLLLMHTDGISGRWRLDAYPGLRHHDPALVAAVLFRDFNRRRDDGTVLTYRDA